DYVNLDGTLPHALAVPPIGDRLRRVQMSSQQPNQALGHNKHFNIVVNGRPRVVTDNRLSYAEVVKLAFPEGPFDGSTLYTVSYANPHGRDGTLAEGQEVEVKDGMSFNVGKTNRS